MNCFAWRWIIRCVGSQLTNDLMVTSGGWDLRYARALWVQDLADRMISTKGVYHGRLVVTSPGISGAPKKAHAHPH